MEPFVSRHILSIFFYRKSTTMPRRLCCRLCSVEHVHMNVINKLPLREDCMKAVCKFL
jgi:hypothetical protein